MKQLTIPKLIQNHPDEVTSRYWEICRELSHFQHQKVHCNINPRLLHMVCAWLDGAIGRDNRLTLFRDAYHREVRTSNDLTSQEAFGLILWCNPYKPENDLVKQNWRGGEHWATDLEFLRRKFGQLTLPDLKNTGEQS